MQLDLRSDPEADWFTGDPGDLLDLDAFVAITARPRWQSDAACRDRPELSWFPAAGVRSLRLVRRPMLRPAVVVGVSIRLTPEHGTQLVVVADL